MQGQTETTRWRSEKQGLGRSTTTRGLAGVAALAAREPLVAALDDWAVSATDNTRQAWVLGVARRADPDAWRDQLRDPVAWGDQAALTGLARTVPVRGSQCTCLVALGERLLDPGGEGTPFLARVQRGVSGRFLGCLHPGPGVASGGGNPEAAVALRGGVANSEGRGHGLQQPRSRPVLQVPSARGHRRFQQALRIDPEFAPAHNNLGLALKAKGWPEAIDQYREALSFDPQLAPAHANLGEARAYQGELKDAIGHFHEALQLDPEYAEAHYMLGVALTARDRLDEANDRYREALRIDPEDAKAHEKTLVGAGAGNIPLSVRFWIDPIFSPSHNHLGLTPGDADRLNEAVGHYEKALQFDPELFSVMRRSAGPALGRFGDALAATRRCLDQLPQGHELHANVLAQLRRCQRLIRPARPSFRSPPGQG